MTPKAPYLRVKNWREHQHYKDRRPPWIKLLRELIDGDNGREFREQLSESEQWQLVRLWLYASGSETLAADSGGREIPLLVNHEPTLRMGIRSLKRIPLDKFLELGFLEACTPPESASATASTDASADASTPASTDPSESDVTNDPPPARARRTEVSERTLPRAVTALRPAELATAEPNGPEEIEFDPDTITPTLREIA